jgi:hypothetical protein
LVVAGFVSLGNKGSRNLIARGVYTWFSIVLRELCSRNKVFQQAANSNWEFREIYYCIV